MQLFRRSLLLFLLLVVHFAHSQVASQSPLSKTTAMRAWYPIVPDVDMFKPPLIIQKGFVVLDPGHGGHDVGTQSISKPRYQEKSLNLVTANFVKGYLQQLGFRVVMTREKDKYISLDKRAQFANEQNPDLFVSIHYNSAPSAEAQGVEVFFYQTKATKKRLVQSKKLAQALLKNVTSFTKAKSRGVKHGNFAVIRETTMPAALIEGGFVTNESELENLKDPVYLKKLAWGIAKGIEEYWDKKKK